MPRRHAGSTLSPYTTLFRSTNAAITTGGKLDAVTAVDNAAEHVEQTDAAGVYGAFSIATDGTGRNTPRSHSAHLQVAAAAAFLSRERASGRPHAPGARRGPG